MTTDSHSRSFRIHAPRRHSNNGVVQPRRRSMQHPRKPKIPPIPPKPCYVFCGDSKHPLVYDQEGKILFDDHRQEPTRFPSRRKAKIAIYWTVQALAKADRLDAAELYADYHIGSTR